MVGMPLLRWGLETLIRTAHPRYEITGAALSLSDALAGLQREPAQLAVLVADALSMAELAVFCQQSSAHVVLVTSSADEAWLDGAVIAGVRAVVHTGDSPDVFLRALEKVADGELWIARSAVKRIFMEMARRSADRHDPEQSKIGTLTVRERQTIAAMISDAAAPGKVVAGRLCISEHTLRNHLTSIYNKLGLANRLDLYAYATRHALVEMR